MAIADAILAHISNFAVGFARRVEGAGSQVLGSGVLVTLDGRRGILTAGHVAEVYDKLPEIGLVRFVPGGQQQRMIVRHGDDLQRLNELRAHIHNADDPNAYFRDFENSLREIPQKLKQFRDIEGELQLLDPVAWDHLRTEAIPYLTRRDPHRGWEQLFNILNQAKAYNFLVRQSYEAVRFVPRVVGRKTPDLEGRKGASLVLCEVKTVNISKDEAGYRACGQARGMTLTLPEGIFNKLKSDMETARDQMHTYNAAADQMIYCIVNFDDRLHEYADDYRPQLEAYVRDHSGGSLEVVFDIKPAFYSAMG